MQKNITVLDDAKFYDKVIPRNGAKLAKLSTFKIVKDNTDRLMADARVTNKVEPEEPAKEVNEPEVSLEPMNVNLSEITPPKPIEEQKIKEEVKVLPLTSEDVIRNKKDILGIEAYKDIESTTVNLVNYQNARRLRVNQVVIGNANRERNINGIERLKKQIPESQVTTNAAVKNEAFEFNNLNSINKINSEISNIQENNSQYDNNTKLDEWLNKETSTSQTQTGIDKVLEEVNELQAKLNDNTSSLATQKEILEALRARIANNEALCRARKKELEEENLNVTRELNDVLSEINQLTNLANEQEAFLGISNDEDSIEKSRVV